MTGNNCDLFTHKLSRSYLNHLVLGVYGSSTLPLTVLLLFATFSKGAAPTPQSCEMRTYVGDYCVWCAVSQLIDLPDDTEINSTIT